MTIEARFTKETKTFGKRVAELRKATGKKQENIAIPVGLTQSQWSLIERGKANFTLYNLVKIAFALEANLSVLFDYNSNVKYRKIPQKKSIDERFKYEKNNFSQRVLTIIHMRNISQDDFALDIEMDPGDLSHFLNGEHNIEFFNIVKIAEGLKVSVLELFSYKKLPPKS